MYRGTQKKNKKKRGSLHLSIGTDFGGIYFAYMSLMTLMLIADLLFGRGWGSGCGDGGSKPVASAAISGHGVPNAEGTNGPINKRVSAPNLHHCMLWRLLLRITYCVLRVAYSYCVFVLRILIVYHCTCQITFG